MRTRPSSGSGLLCTKRTGPSKPRAGTGLGLSIVQAVVDAHEWTLTVAAGTEGGARFEVERIDSMTSGRETTPMGTGMEGGEQGLVCRCRRLDLRTGAFGGRGCLRSE